jgi:hypothetical protein
MKNKTYIKVRASRAESFDVPIRESAERTLLPWQFPTRCGRALDLANGDESKDDGEWRHIRIRPDQFSLSRYAGFGSEFERPRAELFAPGFPDSHQL